MKRNYINTRGYLNTAGAGLVSSSAAEAGIQFMRDMHSSGSGAFFKWREEQMPLLYARTAELLDAQKSEIAFPPNFSFALQGIISGIPDHARVLLIEDDYPSLTLPFKLGGYNIFRTKEATSNDFQDVIEDAILSHGIDVLAVSHVQYKSGFTLDLSRLGSFCQENGVKSIVDCTQSLGAIPISFANSKVDVLIASNYKWMNAGFGSGIVAARADFFDEYPSKFGGFGSFHPFNGKLAYAAGIRALEPGHQAYATLSTLNTAIQERLEMGVQKIWEHNNLLSRQLVAGIREMGIAHRSVGSATLGSAITVIACEEEIGQGLDKRGIANTWREGHLRIAPHFYNDQGDIELFLTALKETIEESTEPMSQLFLGKK